MSARGRVSWVHAVGAVPAAVIAWVIVAAVLTLVLADPSLGGWIATGVVAVCGAALLLAPSPAGRGAGLGTLATAVPCAIGLAITLV